jgi:hypothetical protein
MINLRDYQQPMPKKEAFGRRAVYRGKDSMTARRESELQLIEKGIADATDRSRQLAEELGARYAVFRNGGSSYDAGSGIQDAEIMKLSKETDECIEDVYNLEKRRRELQEIIKK